MLNSPVVQTIFKMFAAKEFGEQVVNIAASFLGNRAKSSTRPSSDAPQEEASSKDVAANKAMKDEAHELHALLRAMSNQDQKTGIFYEIPPDQFWIMQSIWTRLPKGAVKKLFDAFATQIVTRKHTKVTGWTKHPAPEGGGKPRPDTPEKEEMVIEENLMGPQLISGLVWYTMQAQSSPKVPAVPSGTDPELKGVIYVVEMLKSSQRLANLQDDMTSSGDKAAALTARKAAEGDTLLHLLMFAWKFSWREAQDIWNSPHAKLLRTRADNATDPKGVRRHHEDLQRYLLETARLTADQKQGQRKQSGMRGWLRSWSWFITGIIFLLLFIIIPGLPIN